MARPSDETQFPHKPSASNDLLHFGILKNQMKTVNRKFDIIGLPNRRKGKIYPDYKTSDGDKKKSNM